MFGIGQGLIVCPGASSWSRRSRATCPQFAKVSLSAARLHARCEMVRTPRFWVMYVMFVLMAAGGLMATAQLAPIAKDFKIADVPVDPFGLTLPALTFALSIDRVLNGVTRPVFGWISDHIGRENTMFLAFRSRASASARWAHLATTRCCSCSCRGLVFFAWGEIYSLFPATCATRSARSTRRRTPDCSTRPRARRRWSSVRQRAAVLHRQLACGLRGGGSAQHHCGPHGLDSPEANARVVRQQGQGSRRRAGTGSRDRREPSLNAGRRGRGRWSALFSLPRIAVNPGEAPSPACASDRKFEQGASRRSLRPASASSTEARMVWRPTPQV